MSTSIDILSIRRVMGVSHYGHPHEFGPDGWSMKCGCEDVHTVIITAFAHTDGSEWMHASIATAHRVPLYSELVQLHHAVWGDGFAYQQFVPPRFHVNIHPNALHLYGRLDGAPVMPFGAGGTI